MQPGVDREPYRGHDIRKSVCECNVMQRGQVAEQPSPTEHELTARFFRYLGDPTRVKILRLLLEGDKNVGELVEQIGSAQGRVSSHLT